MDWYRIKNLANTNKLIDGLYKDALMKIIAIQVKAMAEETKIRDGLIDAVTEILLLEGDSKDEIDTMTPVLHNKLIISAPIISMEASDNEEDSDTDTLSQPEKSILYKPPFKLPKMTPFAITND